MTSSWFLIHTKISYLKICLGFLRFVLGFNSCFLQLKFYVAANRLFKTDFVYIRAIFHLSTHN